jgi:hypothetical protein
MGKDIDDNLISFTGTPDGSIWRNGEALFLPGTGMREWTEDRPTLPAGRTIDDVLKFSGVHRLRVNVIGTVPGGTEDCVDINNKCRNLEINCPDGFMPYGQYVATIKGGSENITVSGPIWKRAKTVEVDLGNFSDQSQAVTRGVKLGLWMVDNSPVRYRRLNAIEPTLLGHGYKRVLRIRGFFRKLFVKGYAFLKRLGLPI